MGQEASLCLRVRTESPQTASRNRREVLLDRQRRASGRGSSLARAAGAQIPLEETHCQSKQGLTLP